MSLSNNSSKKQDAACDASPRVTYAAAELEAMQEQPAVMTLLADWWDVQLTMYGAMADDLGQSGYAERLKMRKAELQVAVSTGQSVVFTDTEIKALEGHPDCMRLVAGHADEQGSEARRDELLAIAQQIEDAY